MKAGDELSHYQILEPIRKGGIGEVYRAKDRKRSVREVVLSWLQELEHLVHQRPLSRRQLLSTLFC